MSNIYIYLHRQVFDQTLSRKKESKLLDEFRNQSSIEAEDKFSVRSSRTRFCRSKCATTISQLFKKSANRHTQSKVPRDTDQENSQEWTKYIHTNLENIPHRHTVNNFIFINIPLATRSYLFPRPCVELPRHTFLYHPRSSLKDFFFSLL